MISIVIAKRKENKKKAEGRKTNNNELNSRIIS